MQATTEDITVPWGQAPDPADHQYGKWRMAVFQDVRESLDQTKLYFLYDPVADDNCITTGGRKGMTSFAVFDTIRKAFVAEIPLRVQGRVKFMFALNQPSPVGGSSMVVVTHSEDYGQYVLHFWRVDFTSDGLSIAGEPRSLVSSPIPVGEDYIVALREDAPELVVISGPQMSVSVINALTQGPQEPTRRFDVHGAELAHFYDGFVSQGNVYFLSASPDGHLDYSRIHILSLNTQQITTQYCQADPQRGNPPARKQAALDAISGFILLAGGEIDYGNGNVQRLVDYWVLDLQSFKWNQVPAQMPVPLIEPRLSTAPSGNVYVWGDFDDPLPGMQSGQTHVRILRVKGLNTLSPPSYNQAMGGGSQPYGGNQPYPGSGGNQPYPGSGSNQPYPGSGGSYPGQSGNNPPYPGSGGGNQPYPGQQYGGNQPYPGSGASYSNNQPYPGSDQKINPDQPNQPYPGSGGASGPPTSYGPGSGGAYPQQPYQGFNNQPVPNSYQQPAGDAPPQYPYYPPQEKKKDCCIQ
ncbi:unnamed protein product [Bursaphelenchus okinawaensis]|uniref:Uncharacterized protein n=1 Tax=Bursaphelenchus okinawaensis TaxID=465554 RepID=A0A811KQ48_9BILA|nr:unnamed protein product [Bursaphelenchus okinawaensis]CAG9107784.1 unnamed protein product [Bursaphelenchus okinawaensis]